MTVRKLEVTIILNMILVLLNQVEKQDFSVKTGELW